ncbi:hypothetical protein R1flu_008756 [Riccia fluitans]|uniref:Uncharacterized protein n=1 Tax=Riccia fluitans TaxID=41844 RepID=A0ABD1YCV5_9MARC
MSKRRKLFLDEASSSTVKVYLPLDREEPSTSTVQVYQPFAREEPSTSAVQVYQPPAREEASTSAVQVYQPPKRELFQPTRSNISTTFKCIMDLSAAGLRKLVDFLVKEECRRIVPPSKVETEFLKQAGRKYKKDAWQDTTPWFGFSLTHSQPHSEGWVMDDFKKFSLEHHPNGYALDKQVCLVINQGQRMVGKASHSFCSTTLVLLAIAHVDLRMADYHPDWHMWVSSEVRGRLGHGGNDKFSGGKFHEGWEAIMRIIIVDFMAKQATARHEPLLLEARNAFTNTKAEWDSEKENLFVKEKLLKKSLTRPRRWLQRLNNALKLFD